MQFRAKVLTSDGSIKIVTVDAHHEDEVRHMLSASGSRALSIDVLASKPSIAGKRKFRLTVFNQQLLSLLEAGQPIVDAVEILSHHDKSATHANVYQTLIQALKQGRQLSAAMESLPSIFPPLYVAMVRSSETTGSVKNAVKRFMQYHKQMDEIKSKLSAALIYPSILLSVGLLVVIFLLFYVVPRFSTVFDEGSVSKAGSGMFVRAWGNFVTHYPYLAWFGLLSIVLTITFILLNERIRLSLFRRLLNFPGVGKKLLTLQLARMFRTLSLLLRSGLSVLVAMRLTAASMPAILRHKMELAEKLVSEGKSISHALGEHGLTTEVSFRLLLAGESSGNLDEMMERSADFYDQEVAEWVDLLGKLIEPMLMVLIGIIIGGIVLMLYIPIFDLANAVQ